MEVVRRYDIRQERQMRDATAGSNAFDERAERNALVLRELRVEKSGEHCRDPIVDVGRVRSSHGARGGHD
jgi:hypothetical protein